MCDYTGPYPTWTRWVLQRQRRTLFSCPSNCSHLFQNKQNSRPNFDLYYRAEISSASCVPPVDHATRALSERHTGSRATTRFRPAACQWKKCMRRAHKHGCASASSLALKTPNWCSTAMWVFDEGPCYASADEVMPCTKYAGAHVQAAVRGLCENSIYRDKVLPERTGSHQRASIWPGGGYLPAAHRGASASVVCELGVFGCAVSRKVKK
ncbi:hypothetical protein EDB84DRAFT_769074 [Lactarius hengduanensis]|nr:hypothetical protein EDB84DRAFT_769074 [Lactarius hengduanensis]